MKRFTTTVTALEAKARFGQLLNWVARGEEVIITKHGKPVARIVPEGPRKVKSVRVTVADLRKLRQRIAARGVGQPKLTFGEIKSAIAEGRH